MGHHSAATGSTLETPQATPYVGRRRAAVAVEETEAPTPYVGRRRAIAVEPTLRPVTLPERRESSTDLDTGLDTGTIARVLADLEPADQTTSFAHEETAVLPLLRAQPSVAGGKRRAVKHAGSRGPLFRKLPPMPVLLGVATLALSVGGVVTTSSTSTPDLAVSSPSTVGAIGATSGLDGVGRVTPRDQGVSRDGARQTLGEANGTAELEEQVEAQAQERNDALGQLAKDAEARASVIAKNLWVKPMASYRLTATFGQYGLWSSYHTGLDFAADSGTAIMAVAGGTVTSAGYDGAYGYKTVVTLEDGTEIWYAHQSSMYVAVGETVRSGDVIGTVGSTGNVTGPHLHLEVRPGGGDPIDPYAALAAHGVTP